MFGGMINLIGLIIDWIKAIFGSWNESFQYSAFIIVFIVFALWGFSGMAAAQIAEKRGHKTRLHFWLGM